MQSPVLILANEIDAVTDRLPRTAGLLSDTISPFPKIFRHVLGRLFEFERACFNGATASQPWKSAGNVAILPS